MECTGAVCKSVVVRSTMFFVCGPARVEEGDWAFKQVVDIDGVASVIGGEVAGGGVLDGRGRRSAVGMVSALSRPADGKMGRKAVLVKTSQVSLSASPNRLGVL